MDIILFGMVYPSISTAFDHFFIDANDGTVVVEWTHYVRGFHTAQTVGYIVVALRLVLGGRMLLTLLPASTYYVTTSYYVLQSKPIVGPCLQYWYHTIWSQYIKPCFQSPPKPQCCWQHTTMFTMGTVTSAIWMVWTLYSLVVHVGGFGEPTPPLGDPTVCDPLDLTDCSLPFPSFYHLQKDETTETGFRVNFKPESFPMLKGRIPIPMDFLNTLDGFSTMGPILFYMEGMKESHEAFLETVRTNNSTVLKTEPGMPRLRGHEAIQLSVTPYSATLLIDVVAKELVPHSAEIDYLDPDRPLVMVFPAQPLKHNAQYALAVVNATNHQGQRLPPSPGLLQILDANQTEASATTRANSNRKELFAKVVLPALEAATHKASTLLGNGGPGWEGPFGSFLRSRDPMALQLLFDFHTASKKSQLGNVRAVRDHTLKYVQDQGWSKEWDHHVHVVRQIDYHCKNQFQPLARTIHGELDVPWYLTGYGPGYRSATLDPTAVSTGVPNTIGKAKFVIHIPCSLQRAALGIGADVGKNTTTQDLRAIVEFGHGLFGDRAESGDWFLLEMANRNGYILMAMDWRGMSQYDLPVVMRTMLNDLSLFESVRDNLIQGYANKFVLQYFAQNGMLNLPFMKFGDQKKPIPRSVELPTTASGSAPTMFYGISQGGILGAGYVALSAPTGLITRAVLGVPGTPFSLILSRSLDFVGYDKALLMNFYNNRHVRIFLSLAQMCWDSVEASGVLGQPFDEGPLPRILMQAGLGDPMVPTLAAERLARAVGANILPDNPRQPLYGLAVHGAADEGQHGPESALTEMWYEKEYSRLPKDDEMLSQKDNLVHICVRLEPIMQTQLETFFNSDRIIDPCAGANATNLCIRKNATC